MLSRVTAMMMIGEDIPRGRITKLAATLLFTDQGS